MERSSKLYFFVRVSKTPTEYLLTQIHKSLFALSERRHKTKLCTVLDALALDIGFLL